MPKRVWLKTAGQPGTGPGAGGPPRSVAAACSAVGEALRGGKSGGVAERGPPAAGRSASRVAEGPRRQAGVLALVSLAISNA